MVTHVKVMNLERASLPSGSRVIEGAAEAISSSLSIGILEIRAAMQQHKINNKKNNKPILCIINLGSHATP
jgi:hypothetical protein